MQYSTPTDAILIHQTHQVGLRKEVRFRCLAIAQLDLRGLVLFTLYEVRQLVIVPLVVRINIKIVALQNDEA